MYCTTYIVEWQFLLGSALDIKILLKIIYRSRQAYTDLHWKNAKRHMKSHLYEYKSEIDFLLICYNVEL